MHSWPQVIVYFAFSTVLWFIQQLIWEKHHDKAATRHQQLAADLRALENRLSQLIILLAQGTGGSNDQ